MGSSPDLLIITLGPPGTAETTQLSCLRPRNWRLTSIAPVSVDDAIATDSRFKDSIRDVLVNKFAGDLQFSKGPLIGTFVGEILGLAVGSMTLGFGAAGKYGVTALGIGAAAGAGAGLLGGVGYTGLVKGGWITMPDSYWPSETQVHDGLAALTDGEKSAIEEAYAELGPARRAKFQAACQKGEQGNAVQVIYPAWVGTLNPLSNLGDCNPEKVWVAGISGYCYPTGKARGGSAGLFKNNRDRVGAEVVKFLPDPAEPGPLLGYLDKEIYGDYPKVRTQDDKNC